MEIRIKQFNTLPSTNAYLKKCAKEENEGLVIVANSQVSGYGRFGRKFYSPPKSGIYMSILLKPETVGFDATLITSAAAVAVAMAVESLCEKTVKIKWVNDLLIENKKICGILTESSINPNGSLNYIILGIGINAFPPVNGFDNSIKDIAGYVFENNDPALKQMLISKVLENVFFYYKNLTAKSFLEEYRKRSAVVGENILVIKGGKIRPAKALLIDDSCRLKVEYNDKSTEFLDSGEISIKIKE